MDIAATNLVLAGLSLLLILLTATLFNQTLQENDKEIADMVHGALGPVGGAFAGAKAGLESIGEWRGIAGLAGPLTILGLTGLIYGFTEPGFGLNEKSLVLFLALVIGCAIITAAYSGAQAQMTRASFDMPAGLQLFPLAVLVAIGCVALSRLAGFNTGVIYGFIASFVVFGGMGLSREQEGQSVFYPGLLLLTVSVASWLLVGPARDLAQDNDSIWAALPEAILVITFISALEGLFFNMLPLKFMDGAKLWEWNKLAWAALAGVATFLFWHVLLNKEQDSFGAIQETVPAVALVLLGICFVLSIAFWAFFRFRQERTGLV